MKLLKKLPRFIKNPLYFFRDSIRAIPYLKGDNRYCPVCEAHYKSFIDFGKPIRKDAMCPYCTSLERHRLAWLFFHRKTNLFSKKHERVLHIAPEYSFEPRFRKLLGDSYLTADLFNPDAMIKMDITDIQYPDNYFDVIYCSHVLEHVDDDKKAMREFNRVLKNNGWAVLLVPITAEETYEDPTITDPSQRLKLFGQEDHVRRYGPDYKDRLIEAGFNVEVSLPQDIASHEEIIKVGLTKNSGEIYFCRK